MSGWAISIVLFVVIAGLSLGVLAYRRRATPTESLRENASRAGAEPGKKPEQWGVRVASPDKKRACSPVRKLLGKEFPIKEKPQLPLADCPFRQECECRYIKLFDRRSDERRSGQERRKRGERFDKANPPRRVADRRKNTFWY